MKKQLQNNQLIYQVFSFVKMIQGEIEKRETLRRYGAIVLSGIISYSIYELVSNQLGSDSYLLVLLSALSTLSLFYIYDTATTAWRVARTVKKFEKQIENLNNMGKTSSVTENSEPAFVKSDEDKDIKLH